MDSRPSGALPGNRKGRHSFSHPGEGVGSRPPDRSGRRTALSVTSERENRLQIVAARWPRFAWDHHGRARWLSFDESLWTALLALVLLLSVCYLDTLVWLRWGPDLLLFIDGLGQAPGGPFLLVLLLLANAWALDRHLAAKVPAGFREVRWLSVPRRLLMLLPLLNLAVIPLWQRLVRNVPARVLTPCAAGPLLLEGRLPARLMKLRESADVRLRFWSQRLRFLILWLVCCQITPLFSGLQLLFRESPNAAMTIDVVLHLAGAAVTWAHVKQRNRRLQMTGKRAAWFQFLPLAFLLPLPFSLLALLIWLPAAEDGREGQGIVQTVYGMRSARRHPFGSVRGARPGEIVGSREKGRRRTAMAKVVLLALESAVLVSLLARRGSPLIATLESLPVHLLMLPLLPGACLLLAGGAARLTRQWPRLAVLADHAHGAFLTLVPLALLLGLPLGLAESKDQLQQQLGYLGLVGVSATLLVTLWTFLLSLFSGGPEPSYPKQAAWLLCFALLIALAFVPSTQPVVPALAALVALASPLCGYVTASRWLAPLRWRGLNDPRLPRRLRVMLRGLALTALLPFGGLAVPIWIVIRHLSGPDLDGWAAHLREPRE